jgi:hypothetical protein
MDISHKGCMANDEAITFDGLPMGEANCIAREDEVTCLEGQKGATRVLEAYARALFFWDLSVTACLAQWDHCRRPATEHP